MTGAGLRSVPRYYMTGAGLRSVPRYYMTGAGEQRYMVVIPIIINRLCLFVPQKNEGED